MHDQQSHLDVPIPPTRVIREALAKALTDAKLLRRLLQLGIDRDECQQWQGHHGQEVSHGQ
jgi:hypothetical protein